jgi:hypothetical protein
MADYSAFQKLLLDGDGENEAVTVNQRAMIGSPRSKDIHFADAP